MLINVFTRKHFRLVFFSVLLVYILNINAFEQQDNDEEYIDIGVRLTGNQHDNLIADLIAQERDFRNDGLIDGVNLYHFQIRRKRHHRSKRAIDELIGDLKQDERVEFITVGTPLERQKRDVLNDKKSMNLFEEYQQKKNTRKFIELDKIDVSKFPISFDDTLFGKQWYLENLGQFNTPPNHDINVAKAWLAGYSGKDVLICIVDDGLDHPHPELRDHYQPQFSYDLNDLNDTEHDPLPRTFDEENNHGTRCAGTSSSKANNDMCGVGVAYNSNIAGIRVLDGPITTLLEARALTLFAADTDIKSASWGPTDNGKTMEGPGHLVNEALNYGVTYGRQGKGNLFIWASGNGGAAGDDCGADGYVSHHNVISIGSINHLGETPYFSEFCPSTMAVAYTGGQHNMLGDESTLKVGVVAADVGGKCTTSFFGTSAAAPVAAGAFALVLEANPELSYRDVMHITARTARIPNLSETEGWIINGAGYHVNDRYGFGVLDVGQMTALAQNWTNVPQRYECYHEYNGSSPKLGIGATVEVSIDVEKCPNITNIEHAIANVSYSFHRRGDVQITLVSPSKTPSEVLSYRKNDATDKDVKYFPFLTNHNWDEPPEGRWTLRIETRRLHDSQSEGSSLTTKDLGELSHFGLRIYGSYDPVEKKDSQKEKRNKNYAFIPTQSEIESIYKRELAARESPNIMQKRDYQNLLKEKQLRKKQDQIVKKDQSIFALVRQFFGF